MRTMLNPCTNLCVIIMYHIHLPKRLYYRCIMHPRISPVTHPQHYLGTQHYT